MSWGFVLRWKKVEYLLEIEILGIYEQKILGVLRSDFWGSK